MHHSPVQRLRAVCSLSSFLVMALLLHAQPLSAQQDHHVVLQTDGHTAWIMGVFFTADNRQLVSVSQDRTIRFWSVQSGAALKVLRPPIGNGSVGLITATAISDDRQTIAIATDGNDYPIYLIDVEQQKIVRGLRGHQWGITSVAFTPDGRRLLSSSHDSSVKVWDVRTGRTEDSWNLAKVRDLAVDPNGSRFAASFEDGTVGIYSMTRGARIDSLAPQRPNTCCSQVCWDRFGESLLVIGSREPARVWSMPGTARNILGSQAVGSLGNSDRGSKTLVFSGDANKPVVSLVDVKTGAEKTTFEKHIDHIQAGDISPDGTLVATAGGEDNEIYIWDASSGTVAHHLIGKGRHTWDIGWSPDGTKIAWGTRQFEGLVDAFDLEKLDFVSTRNAGGNLVQQGNLFEINVDKSTPKLNTKEFPWAARGMVFRADRVQNFGGSTWYWVEGDPRYPKDDGVWFNASETRPAAYSNYHTSTRKRGSQELDFTDRKRIVVREGARILSTLTHPQGHAFYRGVMLSNDRAALASSNKIYLFDVRTGRLLGDLEGHTGHLAGLAESPDGQFLASTSHDQTTRIWNLRTQELLTSFFFTHSDWIAWTPEGQYAASPAGERLMGWHVNQGRDQLAEFHPSASFHRSFHSEAIIRQTLALGSLKRAKLKEGDVESTSLKIRNSIPPQVFITSPVDSGVTQSEEITVRATARTRQKEFPILKLELLIDSKTYTGGLGVKNIVRESQPERLPGDVTESWTIVLPPGRHLLEVQAVTAVSQNRSEPVEITYKPRFEVEKPKRRLLVAAIGVSQYEHEEIRDLNFAHQDARDFVQTLRIQTRDLFDSVEIKMLTDKEATRPKMLQVIQWLHREATKDDIAILFYSGHGMRDSIKGGFYFGCTEIDPHSMVSSGVSGEVVKDILWATKCPVLMLLDACHSGAACEQCRAGAPLMDPFLKAINRENRGVIVLASTLGSKRASEKASLQNGYFTEALLEGLNNTLVYFQDKDGTTKSMKADLNSDGKITNVELESFVVERVMQLTESKQRPPRFNPGNIDPFYLTKPLN